MNDIVITKTKTIDDLKRLYLDNYLYQKNINNKSLYKNRIFNYMFFINYNNLSIDKQSFDLYVKYLNNIPKELLGIKLSFFDKEWKPFHKQISLSTINQHLIIVKNYLNDKFNFNISYSKLKNDNSLMILDKQIFDLFLNFIDSENYSVSDSYSKRRKARLRWILSLIFLTGSKITELLYLKNNSIKKEKDNYFLHIKNSKILLSDYFLKELKKYRYAYSRKTVIINNDSQLIMSLSSKIEIKTNTIQKDFLELKKQMLEFYNDNLIIKSKIKNISLIDFKKYSIIEHLKSNSNNDLLNEFGFNKNTLNRYINIFKTL